MRELMGAGDRSEDTPGAQNEGTIRLQEYTVEG